MGKSPVKVAITSPVWRFHTFSVLSSEAEITCWPSGVTATAFTDSLWPVRVRSKLPPAGVKLTVKGHSQCMVVCWLACVNRAWISGIFLSNNRPCNWPANCVLSTATTWAVRFAYPSAYTAYFIWFPYTRAGIFAHPKIFIVLRCVLDLLVKSCNSYRIAPS